MELINLKNLNLSTEESRDIIKFIAQKKGISTKQLLSTIKPNLKRKNNEILTTKPLQKVAKKLQKVAKKTTKSGKNTTKSGKNTTKSGKNTTKSGKNTTKSGKNTTKSAKT